ncbi:transporter substrate-binding domain-containing protein [Pusillimonas caeni]|uniref:transporter substrate-binding domain-containing protein n=1 Tax=Pusillimonas caeni TaxID=1348472 RepID=UPI000E59AC30|nr:transporter substrate-binding domain-containing protein [Pusillimonas caeni]TFL11365.1 transporter substrate-binding domain-containing protein [Pusillimonas caeni]
MFSKGFRIFVAALFLGCAQTGAAASSGPDLTVGLRYVPPPFVGGAKVRTPESIETLLAGEVAARQQRGAKFVEFDATASSVSMDSVDFAVADLPKSQARRQGGRAIAIATGQVTRPMAIMRTDTDIKSWRQLKGRTVCLAQDGRYVGRIAERYGAIEQVYRAPADSLLALRTGECDAAVHDDTMLKALLRFPEWKKFSASLPPGEAAEQYFLVPAGSEDLAKQLKEMVGRWKSQAYFNKLISDMTRDIAFEVYLDQTVPDCH